jgi:hypothetical protein
MIALFKYAFDALDDLEMESLILSPNSIILVGVEFMGYIVISVLRMQNGNILDSLLKTTIHTSVYKFNPWIFCSSHHPFHVMMAYRLGTR